MKPRLAHRIDRTHRYVPAVATDIRKTFARERKRLAALAFAALVGCGGGDPEPPLPELDNDKRAPR